MQAAGGQHETLRDRHPFGVPGSGGALEILHHRVQHQACVLAYALGRRQHQFRRDRIALLRHGRGRAAAFHERLVDLAELG